MGGMEGRVELDYKFPTGSKFIYFMLVLTSSKHIPSSM